MELGLQVSATHQATELDRGKHLVLRELISRVRNHGKK